MFALVYVVIGCLTTTLLLLFVVHSRYSPLRPLPRSEWAALDPNAEWGEEGEDFVRFFHLNTLNTDEYTSYNALFVPSDATGLTEVDHVVVSRFGVFVVDTKAWTGRIDGADYQRRWRIGKESDPEVRRNPIRQNRLRVAALANHLDLPLGAFHPIVYFTKAGAWFTQPQPDCVLHGVSLADHINGFGDQLLDAKAVADANRRMATLVERSKTPAAARARRELMAHRYHSPELI